MAVQVDQVCFRNAPIKPEMNGFIYEFLEINPGANGFSDGESIGGVIRDGQLGWIARAANLEVFSLKSGNRVASHSFNDYHSSSRSIITCVAEVNAKQIKSGLLIVGVQRSSVGGLLYLFSVQGSRIVHRIDVIDTITSCCFINEEVCKRGILNAFDGCIAVGTEAGDIFLVDLNLNRCKESMFVFMVFFSIFFKTFYLNLLNENFINFLVVVV